MNRRLTITALVLLICLGIEAQPRGDKPTYNLRKHEFSFSIAALPTRGVIDGHYYHYRSDNDLDYTSSLSGTCFNASTYEIEKTSPSLAFNYFYNINHRAAVGLSISYEGGSLAFYSRSDNSLIDKEIKNILTSMAFIRFTWLNRPFVRMYSLFGLGASYSLEGDYKIYPYQHVAVQASPLCISFGKDIFGYVETGIGTTYFGANLGIGYRF